MNFDRISSDGLKCDYKIVFTADEIESRVEEAVKKKAETFKLAGFRKGHVPLNIVRQNVEPNVLYEVLEKMKDEAKNAIMKKEGAIAVASTPQYKFENSYEKGKDIEASMSLELMPDFDLKPINLEITKIVPKISDKDVEDLKKRYMESRPLMEKAKEEYKIKPGDEVSYKAICYHKGVESKKQSFKDIMMIPLEISEDAELLQGFIGKKVSESFDFSPATNKDLNYKIIIRSIKKALRDVSEKEFAEKRGFGSVESFNKFIRDSIAEAEEDRTLSYHKHQILDLLAKDYDFDVPASIIEGEMKKSIAEAKKELEEEGKTRTDDELRKELVDVVKKRVILGYVFNKIAEKENIRATKQEVEDVIRREISIYPGYAQNILNFYRNNPDAMLYANAQAVERKVVDFLLNGAKKNEVEKTKDEITKILNEMFEDEE